MKKLTSVVKGILVVGALAFVCSTSAVAGPGHPGKHHGGHPGKHHVGHASWDAPHHGHHGKHHGGHWGYGPGVILTGSSDECYTVKRCRINEFGERRCRLEQVCD